MIRDKDIHTILERAGLLRLGWFPSYQEFFELLFGASEQDRLRKLSAGTLRTQDIIALAQHFYTALIAYNAGAPVFKIKPERAQMLVETDLPRDIPVDLLRLPFEGVFLEFPEGTLRTRKRASRMQVCLTAGRFRMSFAFVDDEFGGDTANEFRSIPVGDGSGDGGEGVSIADSVRAIVKETHESIARRDPSLTTALVGEDAEYLECLKSSCTEESFFEAPAFAFAVNAALYITSEGADVVEDASERQRLHAALQGERKKAKRQRLLEALRRVKERKIYICGSRVKYAREMTAALTEEGKRRLSYRFRVRGHWKNQACGKGRLDRKHIFVQPFWKGPTYAEMLERNYVVRAPTNGGECANEEK